MKKKLILLFVCAVTLTWTLTCADISASPHGINIHLAGNMAINKVVLAGVKWMRIDIPWFACEPENGSYNFTEVDRVINYAAAKKLSVLAVIAYTPDWANRGKGKNYPAENRFFWKRFVQKCIMRYKTKVKYWSLWNEPNVPDFFAPGKDIFVNEVFVPGAQIIRAADPAAFIVGPDLAHLTADNKEWFLWMKYVFQNAGKYIDVVSHHIYDSRGGLYIYDLLENGEPLIPSVRAMLEENGMDDRPFWLTETGWNTMDMSADVQSSRYLEMLQMRKTKQFPDKIFFYELLDDINPQVSSWGIVRSDLTEKPAYGVYKDFIAGKYPEPGPELEEEERDCYAEKVFPNAMGKKRSSLLSTLRRMRREMKSLFPEGQLWVDRYYQWSSEVYRLSLKDSRLHRLGREMVKKTVRVFESEKHLFWTRKADSELFEMAARWISLAKRYPLDRELESLLDFFNRNLGKLRQKVPGTWFGNLTEKLKFYRAGCVEPD